MARKPRDTSMAGTTQSTGAGTTAEQQPVAAAPKFMLDERAAPVFRAKHYLVWIGLVIAFCVLQVLVVRLVLGETQGIYFFFGLLVTGFILVSVFDYVYDRHIDPPARDPES